MSAMISAFIFGHDFIVVFFAGDDVACGVCVFVAGMTSNVERLLFLGVVFLLDDPLVDDRLVVLVSAITGVTVFVTVGVELFTTGVTTVYTEELKIVWSYFTSKASRMFLNTAL